MEPQSPVVKTPGSVTDTKGYFVVTLVLTLVSLLLQVLGFICPGWYIIDLRKIGGLRESVGIWYEVACNRRDMCFTYSIFDEKSRYSV